MKLTGILLLALAGCAATPPAPPAPCPDLPELAMAATLADLEAHHLVVVKLYGLCRAARSTPKPEK